MPCEYYLPGEEVAVKNKELNRVTRVACELVTLLRSVPHDWFNVKLLDPDTQAWIAEHDKMDRRRKQDEQTLEYKARLKKKALSKLSAAERGVLGL